MKYLADHDIPLLEALAALDPACSKTTLRSWVKDGRVHVNGEKIKQANLLIKKGEQVEVKSRTRTLEGNVRIVYEDSHFVVIDKPSGLLSVAAEFEKKKTAHECIKNYYFPKKIYVVHRLDQETSGVMLF